MKKLIHIFLAMAMVTSTLTGCATKKEEVKPTTAAEATKEATPETATAEATAATADADSSEPGWKKNASKKEKFTWYINFSWFGRQWGNDVTSKYITEKTGIDVEFIVPAGNEAEKLNTMIASGSLPDIITLGWYEPQTKQIIAAGLVHPLNELADKYDMYFNKVASKEKLGWYTEPDGNVYGYPNASYTPSDFEEYKGLLVSNQTFLVRKDMYEGIGSPDMSTPEGFLAALEKAKEKYPTVDGQPLIPLGFNEFTDIENNSLEGYLQNFLAVKYEKEGKIFDRYTDPEYIKWLKTLRNANEKGLLAKDVFIDKRPQMVEKIAQGRYFSMIYQSQDILTQNADRYNKDPNSAYIAVDFAKNANGDKATLNGDGISGWTVTMISKNCKAPDRAIEFLSYLISEEGQHDVYFGAPELWETVDGKDQFKPDVQALKVSDNDAFENTLGGQNTVWMLMDLAMQQQWAVPMTEPLKQTKDWTKPYVTFNALYDNIDPDADTDPATNLIKIKTKWGSTLPKLLMAESDAAFDKLMEEFTAYRAANGFDEIQQIRSDKLNVNKGKLGIK